MEHFKTKEENIDKLIDKIYYECEYESESEEQIIERYRFLKYLHKYWDKNGCKMVYVGKNKTKIDN